MKKLFKISAKFQLRNKMTKYNIIFLTIMTLLMIFLFSYKATIKNYLDVDIYNWKFTRFFAYKIPNDGDYNWTKEEIDAMQEEIKNIPHVLFTTYQHAFGTTMQIPEFTNDTLDGYIINFAASNDTLPEIMKGTNFPSDNENYLVCPENFYPTSIEIHQSEITSKDKIDLTPYLNSNLTLTFDSFIGEHNTLDFQLVGLYKNDENNYDEFICYTNRNTMIEVGKKLYEGDVSQVSGLDTIDIQTSIFLQIDNFKNTEIVKKQLENLGYVVADAFHFESELDNLNKVKQKLNIFVVMSIMCIFIIEIILSKNFKIENANNFNLLYVLGYKKKEIFKIYLMSNVIQIIVSLMISILIVITTNGILNLIIFVYPFIFNKYRICIDCLSVIITIFLTFFAAIINYISIQNKISGKFQET